MKTKLLGLLMFMAIQANAQYNFEQIDIWSGSSGSSPKYISEFNGKLFFQAAELSPVLKKLYKSDGTIAGTEVVATNINGTETYAPESLYEMNGELYFTAFVSGIGRELFKTDGTDAGTVLIKDIRTGSSNSMDFNSNDDNQLFVEYNNELYFRASTNSSIELWKTDGTESGTVSVKNFEDAQNGAPTFISKSGKNVIGVVFDGLLYFYVNRNGNGELWKTDGTTENTVLVRSSLNNISDMTVYNNELYFSAEDETNGKGRELWVTDGTFAGTTIKHDIFPNNLNPFFGFGSDPSYLTIFNNELYFSARSYNSENNQIIGDELWKTDGTNATLIKDIKPGNLEQGLNIPNFTIYNNELYFVASDNSNSDYELWKTNGTESGTVKVVSVTDTGESIQFLGAINYANKLFYFDSQQLWVTDGTPAGTKPLSGSSEEILQTSSNSLFKYNNKLWFAGTKSGNGNELTSLTDNALSVNTLKNSLEVSVYPNPATSFIKIKSKSIDQEIQSVEVFNLLGKKVLHQKSKTFNTVLNTSSLSKGIYFIKLKTNSQQFTKKIIIE